jgi:F-type H+-transporting ATPase subunit b
VEWAESNINKIKGILEASKTEHTQAVQDRIESVQKMKDVVSLTQGLFAISKVRLYPLKFKSCVDFRIQETAQLEADTFVQKQKVALASDVKAVLDSWVRFEQQQKESEQAELAKAVIENVLSSLKDEKTQREILMAAVSEVER